MFSTLFKAVFGTRNDRLLKKYRQQLLRVNALAPIYEKLSDQDLQAKTSEFKSKVANGAPLSDILFDAFAAAREGSKRALGMRHFDVQIIGGMSLHDGNISEMRTGEGKTLVATLPAYLNALEGKGVHVVTVNDYLAKRDAEWMGRFYRFMGLSVGMNLPHMERDEKQQAYLADITYGTNNEFGFDYLRDNLVIHAQDRSQRGLHFAIIDEVDSILIDEARTPLIISGPAQEQLEMYHTLRSITKYLEPQAEEPTAEKPDVLGDYFVDEKSRQVHLSDTGLEKIEKMLVEMGVLKADDNLYSPSHIGLMQYITATMRAHLLYHRDQHYVVQEGEVLIVDEFTGRLMKGRRWSEGLHQAIEAKEGVKIQQENQTLASITFQNYFRMYKKLSGMTGTADTEAYEFQNIYNLETMVIPTHRPMLRRDENDLVYASMNEKYLAILKDIQDCRERGQPVLVGTASIESSEKVSAMLAAKNVPHQVLNAKQHAKEAEIISQAGRSGVVTIATNMAGRGTDIVLGGSIEGDIHLIEQDEGLSEQEKNDQIEKLKLSWQESHDAVLKAGGLRVVGTERNESRRIDNQLRGRSGRQGDSGSSRFYLSMEDPLMRIFAGDRIRAIMTRFRLPEGEAIESKMVSRAIETAQRRVEGHNFEIRKQLLEYDDIANEQRHILYEQRNQILEATQISDLVRQLRRVSLTRLVSRFVFEETMPDSWDLFGLDKVLQEEFALETHCSDMLQESKSVSADDVLEYVIRLADESYQNKVDGVGAEQFAAFERVVALDILDHRWRKHLTTMEFLRQSIHLRGYGQKNPKDEYKKEAFVLFESCLNDIRDEVTRMILRVQIRSQEEIDEERARVDAEQEALEKQAQAQHVSFEEVAQANSQDDEVVPKSAQTPVRREVDKIGRNDPCPCGSGKKYKQCHGKLD